MDSIFKQLGDKIGRSQTFYLGIFFFFFSCDKKSELRVEKYKSGELRSEIYYLGDTMRHGSGKFYYKSGVLRDEIEYVHGVANGTYKHYYEDGKIKAITNVKDGVVSGEDVRFYQNGKKLGKLFFVNKKPYGSGYFYYENGRIATYQCEDFTGEFIYIKKWDEEGNLVKEEGLVFSPNFQITPANDVHVGDTIKIEITAAEPPATKTNLYLSETVGSRHFREEGLIMNSTVTFKRVFDMSQDYSFSIVGVIRDSASNNVILKDSVMNVINIK